MSQDLDTRARSLLQLYRDGVRPLLEEHEEAPLDQLDRAAKVLEDACNRSPTLSIGFLGESQVGKSSIINAILSERVLPSGGIGPLTAQATGVTYRDVNALEVRYHGKQRLNQVAFAIRSYLSHRGELPNDAIGEPESQDLSDAGEIVAQALASIGAPAQDSVRVSEVCEHLLSSVRLMLHQDGAPSPSDLSRTALLDAVRMMVGSAPYGDPSPLVPYQAAIARVRERLGESETIEENPENPRAFRVELRLRAAGWLSPIVDRLDVSFRNPFLRDLRIVDLPGVNNFADAGGSVAQEFVRRRDAGALAIVLRNNGITAGLRDLIIEVLDRFGVIEKLLWHDRDDGPSIKLLFLVTHMDNVAKDRWQTKREEAELYGDPLPDPDQLFAETAREMEVEIRRQFGEALKGRLAAEDGSDAKRQRVEQACRELTESLEVLCVAAPDFQDLRGGGGQAFLRSAEATSVPRLQTALTALGQARREARERDLAAALEQLWSDLDTQLGAIARTYEEGGGFATSSFERFRVDLETAAAALSESVKANHRDAERALTNDVEERIFGLLDEARRSGLKRLRRLRTKAESMHWASLNAALTHKGRWTTGAGRTIDYPDDLTKAMSEEIASSWDATVIQAVRGVMKRVIAEDLSLVETLCERATALDSKLVGPGHVEEQRQILRSAMSTSVRWTKDRLKELTDEVETTLPDVMLPPLVKACNAAKRAGTNYGKGAKERIIGTFESGGTDAIDTAIEAARNVLKRHYGKLLREIREDYLRDGYDPVRVAFESLTNDERTRARRADARRRRRVLDTIGEVRAKLAHLTWRAEASA